MNVDMLRANIAEMLDATHHVGERDPRTYLARQRLATYLDTGKHNYMRTMSDIAHLRKVTRPPHP